MHFKSDYFRTLFDAIRELEHETAAREVLVGFEELDDTVPPERRAAWSCVAVPWSLVRCRPGRYTVQPQLVRLHVAPMI